MPTAFSPPAAAPARSAMSGILPGWRGIISDLLSFEMIFLLFLYSNVFQVVLPKLPVDTTYVFLGLSLAAGGLVLLREGIYIRGFFLVMAILPYFAWLMLSLTWSISKGLAYDYLKIVLTANFWCLIAGAMIIAHKRERMLRFLRITIALSVIVAVMGIYIYQTYGSFKFAGWQGFGRVYNNWGRAVANGAVILLVLFLRSRFGSGRQLVLGALLALCTFFIFIASSRSALLSLAVPTLLFMIVNFSPVGRQGFAMSRAQFLLLMVVLLVVTLVVVLLSGGHQIDTLNRFQKVFRQAENTDLVLGPNRWAYYSAAVTLIFQSPLIGHGVRSFSLLFKGMEDPGAHPHNLFLEVLADTGIIGLVLFLLVLLVAFRPISRARLRADPMLLCVTMLFVGRFTAAMVGSDIANQQPLFVFLGFLALTANPRTGPAGIGEEDGVPPTTALDASLDGPTRRR